MKRIVIIGSGGAGKSTLAKKLSEILQIEVLHLDKLYWIAGWQKPSKLEWQSKVEELLKKDSWIMDGNFGGTMETRLAACDTAIFLDLPRTICLYRILKRWWTYRNTNRPDMTEGCNEKVDFDMLDWVWTFPKRAKPEIEARLKKVENEKKIIRLKSPQEVQDFLESCKKN
ncbi:MAG: DNA topology modulation protein [Pyrinomonadaceae bacterium]|nr:DNA topology modulation protein [Pyrinomonadaceae bacterium]